MECIVTGTIAIIAFVVVLVVCVLIHELGHLLTAKSFGMRADRYFVGFGPTLWSTRRGETEYGLKAFPLGGFVSIRGMTPLDERRAPLVDEIFAPQALGRDRELVAEAVGAPAAQQPNIPDATWSRLDAALIERGASRELTDRIVRRTRATVDPSATVADGRVTLHKVLQTEVGDSQKLGDLPHRLHRGDEGRFYHDRPIWQRAITIFTGPITHLGIAFVVLLGAYVLIPLPTGELVPEVGGVLEDSPAEAAGLQPGDRLVAVDGTASDDYLVLRDAIRARAGVPTALAVERDGELTTLQIVPRPEEDPETGEVFGLAGFEPTLETDRLAPTAALRRAAIGDEDVPLGGVVPMLGASVQGLAAVFSPDGLGSLVSQAAGSQERDPQGAISLVGAASFAGQTAGDGGLGLLNFLFLLASINVFFFIFNLVPLPPFDGGHLAVLGIEKTVNLGRRIRGRATDYTVDPRAITAVALPVLGVLLLVLVATLWLDITNPIQL
jgi:regulator of sigma E protease